MKKERDCQKVVCGLFRQSLEEETSTLTLGYGSELPKDAIVINPNVVDKYIGSDVTNKEIKKIVINNSFAEFKPTSTAYWFANGSLTSIEGLGNLNTENVVDMNHMFYCCQSITNLDLGNFKTDKVTDMSYMFYLTRSLKVIDLSTFDTRNVTDMSRMFSEECGASVIYVSDSWTTKSVTKSEWMFGCPYLYGEKGTYAMDNDESWSIKYAHVDEGESNPGYFTRVGEPAFVTKSVYVVFNNGVLTFHYDNKEQPSSNCFKINSGSNSPEWKNIKADITSVVFEESFKDVKPTTCYQWFSDCNNLKEIDGIENLNTENVTDMSSMFNGCSGLADLDLSNFNTANVTSMSYMFKDCSSLTSLDLSSFNTINVTNMNYMFSECSSLKQLDISSFIIKKYPTYADGLFANDVNLTTIYIGQGWDRKNLRANNTNIFLNCNGLVGGKGTVFHDDWNNNILLARADFGDALPGYLTDKSYKIEKEANFPYVIQKDSCIYIYFDGNACKYSNYRLISDYLKYRYNDPAKGTTYGVKSVKKIIIDESFNRYKPTTCDHWFCGYSSLKEIVGLKNINTENVSDMRAMFKDCISLKHLDLTGFETKNVVNMCWMFDNCKNLLELDLSSFSTKKIKHYQNKYYAVDSILWIFRDCIKLERVIISDNWIHDTELMYSNTPNLNGCYGKCCKLTLNTSTWNGYAIFDGNTLTFGAICQSIPASAYPLDTEIPGWSDKALKIEKVVFPKYFQYVRPTTLYGWFFNCRNLTEIEGLEYLNTEDVEDMGLMFAGCKNLVSLDLSNFNTQNVTSMKGMFGFYDKDEDKGYYCDKLETIFVGDGWTTKYTEDDKIFEGCKKLVGGLGSTYNEKNVSTDYAHIDGGKSSPGYLTYMPDEAHKTVAAIAMNALPKTEYIQGEPLSTTGGTIKVDYNNMTTDIIDLSNAEITGFDTEKVGNQVLVVTYYDKKTTYEINVKAKTITKLEVTTLPKTEYGIGEKINLDGGVLTVSYSNNLSEKVALSQAKVSGYDPMKLGTQKLSVIYLQNETSFEVKVVEKPAKSIAVTTLPKVLYVEGDAFSAEGGIITITYDGGAKGESNLTNAKLSGFEPNKISEQTIKVEYLGCETSYKVTVKELAYYNVTYKVDGEIYGEVERVKLGSAIIPREAPAKDGYTFSGWSEIPANMPDHDIEIVGTFTKDATPEDPTTPTSEIAINSSVKIWSFDRTIVIENPGRDIQIVDINGRLVNTMKTDDSRIEIPMSAPGIYIVKTVAKTQKVIIK